MATTTTSTVIGPLSADGWRRVVFMYVGPGKRRQWAARLGSPGRPVSRLITAMAGSLSVVLSLLVFYLAGRIATYGMFFTGGADAWGGPTLAGAWFVHALIAAAMVVFVMWLLIPLTNLVIRGLR
ncbi:MAG: hypothetical protein ABW224_16115 [Kibdelosporangium sp.]